MAKEPDEYIPPHLMGEQPPGEPGSIPGQVVVHVPGGEERKHNKIVKEKVAAFRRALGRGTVHIAHEAGKIIITAWKHVGQRRGRN